MIKIEISFTLWNLIEPPPLNIPNRIKKTSYKKWTINALPAHIQIVFLIKHSPKKHPKKASNKSQIT